MGRLIGIDLGTTNSVAAIVDGPQPRVLENREARTQTRSAVGLRKRRAKSGDMESQVLVGDAAIDNWPLAPKDTIISVKRLMGRGAEDPDVRRLKSTALYSIIEPSQGTRDSVRVLMGGQEYSPIEVSAMILKKIKEDAEFRLGEPVTHAVITVPAYFTQIQRDATRKAGLLANLKVIKILDEPTAAAVAFGVQSSDDTPRTVLVYDLGGGTFDISVLMCAGHVFAPLNLEGNMWLGGDNFDDEIVKYALRHVETDYGVDPRGNVRFMAELKRAAQTVKERLSAADSADLIVTGLLQDAGGNLIDIDLNISRRDFERMILHLVGNYVKCANGHTNFVDETTCVECRAPIVGTTLTQGTALELTKKALRHPSVKLRPDQVDYVVMAGNSTNIPLVQKTMEELFGPERVVRKTHPKHAVALGAAIVASWMGQRLVCQAPDAADPSRECGEFNDDAAVVCKKCGASLGVEHEDAPREPGPNVGGIASVSYGMQAKDDVYSVFIRKNDPVPTQEPQAQVFRTTLARQRMISIPIYGGEDMTRASANEKQGEAFAVLPADLPKDTPIRIKLWLNGDGVLEISAHLTNGTNLQPWLVKGEKDARAIAVIEQIEKALGDGGALQSMDMAQIDAARNRAFDKLRNEEFDEALREAEKAKAAIEAARTGPQTPEESARGLLEWAVFVLNRYAWAFDTTMQYRLRDMTDRLTGALDSRDAGRVQAAYSELDLATRTIPRIVETLLGLRIAINTKVRPGNPGAAGNLFNAMDRLEGLFQREAPEAPTELAVMMTNVQYAIEEVARTIGLQCSKQHPVPKGERFCPVCREDTWSLAATR